jgi:hypothetical protein
MVPLNTIYLNRDLYERMLAARIADLAVELARQAGEEVKRPLSREQLDRALSVNAREADIVTAFLWEGYEKAHSDGTLPAQAYLTNLPSDTP